MVMSSLYPYTSRKHPEYARHLAENLHIVCIDRFERVVLGLQADAPTLPEEALDGSLAGRLVLAGQGDDYLAVVGALLPMYDEDVAVEDAGTRHRVALDAQ